MERVRTRFRSGLNGTRYVGRLIAAASGTQDGTYLVTYRLTTAGEYQLRVMYAPRHRRAARTHASAHTRMHARTRAVRYNEVDLPGSPFVCYLDPLPNEMCLPPSPSPRHTR
jgi:hypothetical protein